MVARHILGCSRSASNQVPHAPGIDCPASRFGMRSPTAGMPTMRSCDRSCPALSTNLCGRNAKQSDYRPVPELIGTATSRKIANPIPSLMTTSSIIFFIKQMGMVAVG